MIQSSSVYTDFQGLRQLEAGARERDPEVAREAARQFEALFLQMMLKSMRDANAVLAEERDTTYDDMFDRQISLDLSRGEGIGIADLLMRQLGGAGHGSREAAIDPSGLQQRTAPRATSTDGLAELAAGMNLPGREDFRPQTPEDFLREIWPLAERAGERLGIDPRAVAAQATLETGWGRHQIRDAAGISGNNLFGIKADRRWDGEQLRVPTLEYDGGIPKRRNELFRAYQNLQDGFDDYVNFLRTNPRYASALDSGGDARQFAVSLQQAGYATDPSYADKILRVMQSSRFSRVLGELKPGGALPTS